MRLSIKSRTAAVALVTATAFVAAQLPTPVYAQGVAVTQAESLYNQGKDLVEQKKYKEACDKFQASLKLDETVNTHVALARCLDLDGRTASAWGEYLMASKKGAGTPAGQYAQDQAKAIEKRLIKVKIVMTAVPDDLVLKIDNETIPKESVNGELPLDPGEHKIEASATGKHKENKTITLTLENSPLSVPITLTDMTPEELKAQAKLGNGNGNGGPSTETVEDTGSPIRRWIGVGMIGAGVIGIVVGVVFLVQASGETTKFNNEGSGIKTCTSNANGPTTVNATLPSPCHATDSTGLTFADRANRFYITMGVAGGLGVVLAGVGTALVLTSFGSKKVVKHDDAVSFVPMISPTMGGMAVLGRF
jgi:hypothetical protein